MFQNAKYQKQKFRDAIGSVRRTVTVRLILPTNDRDNTSNAHQPNTCFIQEMKRNVEMRKRVQKRGVSRKLDIHKVIARENTNGSASGYCSQESTSSHFVVRLPKHQNV